MLKKILFLLFLTSPLLSLANQPLRPPPLPEIEANSYILQDFHSGHVIMEKNADQQVEPASLTKLMTAYVVFNELKSGRLKFEDTARISENAWRMGGSKMYIKVDSEVKIIDLLRGMIVQSGNDASVALAEHLAGSEAAFAGVMNQFAQRLALTHTFYTNSTGMPGEGHLTTARDMAKMATALIRDFPEYYRLYSEKAFTYNEITQQNRNLLLWRDASVDGMKTGYTQAAGYCLIASAEREGMRLVSVVMGTSSKKARANESQKMLNYGFRFYATHQVYPANQALKKQRVWQGALEQVGLGLNTPLFITIPRGQYQQLKPQLELKPPLIAPIKAGEIYGKLKLLLQNNVIAERPLVALHSVEEGDLLQWLVDSVLLKFE